MAHAHAHARTPCYAHRRRTHRAPSNSKARNPSTHTYTRTVWAAVADFPRPSLPAGAHGHCRRSVQRRQGGGGLDAGAGPPTLSPTPQHTLRFHCSGSESSLPLSLSPHPALVAGEHSHPSRRRAAARAQPSAGSGVRHAAPSARE